MSNQSNRPPGGFIQLAADAAARLKEDFEGQPEMEFLAWTRIALQREAMVSIAYNERFVTAQLEAWQRDRGVSDDVLAAVRRAIANVWVQEETHQRYFSLILTSVYQEPTLRGLIEKEIDQFRGKMEGVVVGSLMSDSPLKLHLARIAASVSSYLTDVPEYVRRLSSTGFRDFCMINGDLECTAVSGYHRMLELADEIRKSRIIAETTAIPDITRTAEDERYHEALFRALADWPPPFPGGKGLAALPPGAAADSFASGLQGLHDLLATARAQAYGDRARVIRDKPMEIDELAIPEDAFIVYLRGFVEDDTGLALSRQSMNA